MKCAEGAVGTGLGKCPKNSFLSFLNMHPFLIRLGICESEGGQGIVFLGFPILTVSFAHLLNMDNLI